MSHGTTESAIDTVNVSLKRRSRCPHCWSYFAPEDSVWIAAHGELIGDKRLGTDAPIRFLPSRFNVDGKALDQRGLACSEIACPGCHLQIPRAVLQMSPLFLSIAGRESCGKSYFLASMTWQLRRTLPEFFQIGFSDAEGIFNRVLNSYEEEQFFNIDQDRIVKLNKTQMEGDWYSQVQYDDQVVVYPKPFMFTAKPLEHHPSMKRRKRTSRLVCLYDIAGEYFQAGRDTVTNAATRHLSIADAWLFCFDPTQDPRFRGDCEQSEDFQIVQPRVTARQETVFHEMVARIRKHSKMSESGQSDRPLIVLCNKYDAWWKLLGKQRLPDPWRPRGETKQAVLDLKFVRKISDRLRELVRKYSPELVAAAEDFSSNCYFLPASATGVPPEQIPGTDDLGVRPKNMNPMWCDVPLLVVLAERARGLLPRVRQPSDPDGEDDQPG